ncbi:MAG: hypothetical protein AAF311_05365, partial [Pseudomonadota bacterium]
MAGDTVHDRIFVITIGEVGLSGRPGEIGNFGIGHNEGEIKGNAKIGGVINKAAQQDLQQAATEIQQ